MSQHYRVRAYRKDQQAAPALKRRQQDRATIEHLAMCKAMGIDPKAVR